MRRSSHLIGGRRGGGGGSAGAASAVGGNFGGGTREADGSVDGASGSGVDETGLSPGIGCDVPPASVGGQPNGSSGSCFTQTSLFRRVEQGGVLDEDAARGVDHDMTSVS